MTKTKIRKKSLRPYPKLKAEAEKWFHLFIRLRDSLKTTKTVHHCICYTCGKDIPFKQIQAGHFRHGKLDFDEDNLHGQCQACNKWGHGKLDLYTIHLINDYGKEFVDDLILRSNQTDKRTRQELEDIIAKYKEEVLKVTGLHNAL
jgi:hypothetical protein